jgi:hypothetical protein
METTRNAELGIAVVVTAIHTTRKGSRLQVDRQISKAMKISIDMRIIRLGIYMQE